MPNVKIDQQFVEIQVGRQYHTAIIFEQLVRYCSPIKSASPNKVSLPMEDSNETLLINLTNSEKRIEVLPIIVFKDELIKVMRRILNGQKSQIVTQLEQFYLEEPLLPNHQRLIRWLMDLAEKGNKPTPTLSIEKGQK